MANLGTIEDWPPSFATLSIVCHSLFFLPISVFSPRGDPKEAGWGHEEVPVVRAQTNNKIGGSLGIMGYSVQTLLLGVLGILPKHRKSGALSEMGG